MKLTDVSSTRISLQPQLSRSSPAPAPAPAAPAPELVGATLMVSEDTLNKGVERMNMAIQRADEHLQFSVHKETNRIVVKLVDTATDEVVREFPAEKFLDLVANLMKLSGLNVDETI